MHDEQADLWKKDYSNYQNHEDNLNGKVKQLNMENAEFLKNQMIEKNAKKKKKMTHSEYLMNKELLEKMKRN